MHANYPNPQSLSLSSTISQQIKHILRVANPVVGSVWVTLTLPTFNHDLSTAGLVAIALTSEEHAEAAIRGPLVAAVSKYLRHATTISAAAGSAASTLPTHLRTSHSSELTAVPIATALAAATATAAVTAAAAAAAAAASAAVTAAADEAGADAADPMDEGGGPPAAVSVAAVAVEGALLFRGFGSGSMCMQSRRLVYCCQIWAEMGEYLEALGPVLHVSWLAFSQRERVLVNVHPTQEQLCRVAV